MAAVVGIAGPSCSGKSTVAGIVAARLGAAVFRLDAYWDKSVPRPSVNGFPSFERPEQYRGGQMAADIAAHLERHPGQPVVAEGFLLFLYPRLLGLCGTRAFLDVPDAVLAARRRARAGEAGDGVSAGGKVAAAEAGWLANGAAEWREFGARQAWLPGVARLDAGRPPAAVADDVLALARGGPAA